MCLSMSATMCPLYTRKDEASDDVHGCVLLKVGREGEGVGDGEREGGRKKDRYIRRLLAPMPLLPQGRE